MFIPVPGLKENDHLRHFPLMAQGRNPKRPEKKPEVYISFLFIDLFVFEFFQRFEVPTLSVTSDKEGSNRKLSLIASVATKFIVFFLFFLQWCACFSLQDG